MFDTIIPVHIRKNRDWRPKWYSWWIMMPVFMIIIPILAGCFFVYDSYQRYQSFNYEDVELILWIIVPFVLICVWFNLLRLELSIIKLKRNKRFWVWSFKTLPITSIEHYVKKGKNWYSWYYLEIDDWDIIYCSDAFSSWKYRWTSLYILKKIYNQYWFEYDEKYKEDVLRAIDSQWSQSVEEDGLLGMLKSKIFNLSGKYSRPIVEKGYVVPSLEVNWVEVKVWDTVDVYIDESNPKNYWVDTDSLFKLW